MTRNRDFKFKDRALTVRAAAFSEGWRIRVFESERAVTDVEYTVTHETALDATVAGLPTDLVEDLMTLAQKDVEAGRVKLASKQSGNADQKPAPG